MELVTFPAIYQNGLRPGLTLVFRMSVPLRPITGSSAYVARPQ